LLIHFLEPVMKPFLSAVKAFVKDEEGITAIEYGLIAALMATAIATAFAFLGTGLKDLFTAIQNKLSLT
ncbi:MAG TPA: Flp family type IVb pilin, partial [Janthinobacterium sp.]|nr:Flp family type IVb pilin [Janthinobacterium sp.]